MTRVGARHAGALMQRLGLAPADLLGLRFSINVAIAAVIVWGALDAVNDKHPIWAIASMIAAAEPQPEEARRMFSARLVNVAVGSLTGFLFLLIAGPHVWILPLALAAAVLLSSYVVRVKTMWRQAPITAAIVIASAVTSGSSAVGFTQGLYKVAEVVFGCVVGLLVSQLMSKVWLIPVPPDGSVTSTAHASRGWWPARSRRS